MVDKWYQSPIIPSVLCPLIQLDLRLDPTLFQGAQTSFKLLQQTKS